MEDFVFLIISNPVTALGYVLALVGGLGVLISIGGIMTSLKHQLTYSVSAHHLEHSRTRSLWGLYLAMVCLGIWETVRLLLGETPGSTVILILILLSPAWIPWLKALLTGKSGGH